MVGRWSVRPLRAGNFRLDGGGMFGLVPKTMWSRWIEPDSDNRVGLATNVLLLEDGVHRVLVESGYGDKWCAKHRAIYSLESRTVVDALAEVSVAPEDIDFVILTHLHFDHAGGTTRRVDGAAADATPAECIPTFARARIIVQSGEWQDACANRSTMTATYLPNNLAPLQDKLLPVEQVAQPLSGISVRVLTGHTRFQQGVWIESTEGTVVFPADLLPTIHHAHPSASLGYDMCAYDTMATKLKFLHEAHEAGWILALDHDPVHQLARTEVLPNGRIGLKGMG
ncbi:MAG: MBL fold metallo-hydrolase [Phycisphaerales bacterium]|nr:MBL fold metallo-hydrolase [Phycisphaerales bacterium]